MEKMQLFLTTAEAAEILKVSDRAVRKLLQAWGVKPCADLGAGRGMGLRWRLSEIVEAGEKTVPHRETPPPRPDPRLKKRRLHALDQPINKLVDELAGS